jgi:hypothetical protein
LADTDETDAELGDIDDPATELAVEITPLATTGTLLGRYLKEITDTTDTLN